MKKAPDWQVNMWISDLVRERYLRLPFDHPNRPRIGGAAAAEIRKRARNAETRLAKRGLLPTDAELAEKANGGVDIEKFRAERAAKEEREKVLRRVTALASAAPTEKLRAALAALEA